MKLSFFIFLNILILFPLILIDFLILIKNNLKINIKKYQNLGIVKK